MSARKAIDKSKCKHKFYFNYRRGKTLGFRCIDCFETVERTASAKELRTLDRSNVRDVHKVYHRFLKRFMDGHSFKLKGYQLSDAVERWAARQPEGMVRIASCDDDHFTTSILVFIQHQTADEYMGTTVVYIPQNGDPATFFMYSGHLKELQDTLQAIRITAKPIQLRHMKLDRQLRREINKWRP